MLGAPGLFWFLRYQVAGGLPNWPIGSKAPTVVTPSPFQSPTAGIQPAAPYANGVMSGAPGLLLLRSNQVSTPVVVLGRATPMVVMPSPFQSPTTGRSPGCPYLNGGMSGAPGLLLLRRYQVMVAGPTTPMVVMPSPVQSPATPSQPGPP